MTASLSELSKVAEQLNKESAKVNAIICRMNESLSAMNIGVDVWLDRPEQFPWAGEPQYEPGSSPDDPTTELYLAEQLGYTSCEDNWQLALRLVEVRVTDGKREFQANADRSRPLIKASRNLRIASLELLPVLTDAIKQRLESMIASIAKSAGGSVVVVTDEDQELPVEELKISVRTYNCLKNANISTLRELVVMTEDDLLKNQNFGRKSLQEINDVLASLGFSLGMIWDTDGNLVKR
jgi:hypothetical protein